MRRSWLPTEMNRSVSTHARLAKLPLAGALEGRSREREHEGSHSRLPRLAALYKVSCLRRQKLPRGLFLGPNRRLLLRPFLLICAQRAPAQPPKPSHLTAGWAEARHLPRALDPAAPQSAGSLARAPPCCLGSTARRAPGEPEVCALPGPWLPGKTAASPGPARRGLGPRRRGT